MSSLFNPDQCHAYFAARLPGYKWNGHAQISCRCPFHDDGTASFSLNLDEGRWTCHAGCGKGGIFAFEEKFSACDHDQARRNVAELLGISLGPAPEGTYVYRDALGHVVFRKRRFPGKRFVCERPKADGKGWVDGLDGILVKPLYNLPQLIRAAYVVVVEGEKDVDRLTDANLSQFSPDGPVAVVCNFDGAGPGKWRAEYGAFFAGRQVAIIPDRDKVGEEHALACAHGIYPFAAGIKLVRLSGVPDGGDVSDYLDAGHTAKELVALIAETPAWRPDDVLTTPFHSVAEIIAAGTTQASWIVPFYVEQTAITSLSGKIKVGKTSFLLAACKAVLGGTLFLNNPTIGGPVVMVTEQAGSSFIAALQRAGIHGDENLRIMQPHHAFGMDWPAVVAAAVSECNRIGARLLVIDTINTVSGLSGDAENSAGAMLEIMRPLQQASGRGFAIVYTAHERKSGGDVSDAARGSSAVGGCADVLMSLTKPAGNHRSESVRKISSVGRFSETPAELVIDLTPDGEYVVLGNSDAVSFDRATQAVMAALPIFADSAVTLKVLCAKTGESRSSVQRALKELGAVLVGDGERNNPIRYWRRAGGGQ